MSRISDVALQDGARRSRTETRGGASRRVPGVFLDLRLVQVSTPRWLIVRQLCGLGCT